MRIFRRRTRQAAVPSWAEPGEQALRHLIADNPDGILVVGGDGVVLFANAAAGRLLGTTAGAIVGTEFGRPLAAGELTEIDAPGTGRCAEMRVSEIDWKGRAALLASLRDITERRHAERTRSQLAAIVEASDDAITSIGTGGFIETWNGGAARLYGYSAEEAIGRPLSELFAPDDVTERARILARALAGNRIDQVEVRDRRKDGAIIDVSLTESPIRDSAGRIVAVARIARDITAAKQAQAEREEFTLRLAEAQRLEALGVVAGAIAHDFNNLLTVVLGNTSLALSMLPAESPLRALLEQVDLASRRSADLTRQLLAYAGKGHFVVEQVSLSEVVTEMAELIAGTISKNASLSLRLAPHSPAVHGDATQIRQVVLNLITNASEAVHEQGGTITVTTGSVDADRAFLSGYTYGANLEEGRYATLEVADDGPGMSAETAAKIFEPFFTTKFAGRGLGLAAVQGIVRAHGGAIRVDTAPGAGASFELLFPACGELSAPRPETVAGTWSGRGAVLVADDDAGVRALAAAMLEELGFAVTVAGDGAELLAALAEQDRDFAFILLDLTMPGLSGEDVLAELDRMGVTAPIILSSGYNTQELSQRLVGTAVATFLQKPYTFDQLREAARKAVEGKAEP